MKTIKFITCLLLCIIGFYISSCTKMDDYKKYTVNGEIKYTGRVDSTIARAGQGRIKLTMMLGSDPARTKIRVYWNNGADSAEMKTKQTLYRDTENMVINNLPEGSYNFNIYTYDDKGHTSVLSRASGNVYGSTYQNILSARGNNGFTFDGIRVTSLWLPPRDQEVGTQIQYTTEASISANVLLSRDSAKINLPSLKYGTSISYRSAFLPEKAAIDTFFTAWATLLPVYNPYPGKYSSVGTISIPVTGSHAFNKTKVITRIDNLTSQVEVADMGTSYSMNLKVNADFSVTITPIGSTVSIDQRYGANYYDPATKSFHLNYGFLSVTAPRIVSEVITRTN